MPVLYYLSSADYSAALLTIDCVLIMFIVLMPTNEFLFLALQIMAKRKLEIDTLGDITEPIPTASLHGVIQTVSLIKKGTIMKGN